jgi:hypothetical protein
MFIFLYPNSLRLIYKIQSDLSQVYKYGNDVNLYQGGYMSPKAHMLKGWLSLWGTIGR